MITRVQSNNNKTLNFGALKMKPVELGQGAQTLLSKAENFSSVHQRLALGGFAFLISVAKQNLLI